MPFLYLLLLFLASNLVNTIEAQVPITITNSSIPNCPTFNCGDNVIVPYPFWVGESDPSSDNYKFCGYPELEISCLNNAATFKTLSDSYTVTNINVERKTFSLFDTDVKGSTCPRVKHQVDLSSYPNIMYAPEVVNLTFYFDCNPNLLTNFTLWDINLAPCLQDKYGTSFVFEGEVPRNASEIMSKDCSNGSMVSPVLKTSVPDDPTKLAQSFGDVLKRGFELQWKDPLMHDCVSCEKTGGYCGYRNPMSGSGLEFLCFCRDGTQTSTDCTKTETRTRFFTNNFLYKLISSY